MEFMFLFILCFPSTLTALHLNKSLLIEGDVIRDEKPHLLTKRMTSKGSKWSNGVIPYAVGPNLESIEKVIEKVAIEFAQKTCIRFVPKKLSDEHFVKFIRDDSQCGRETVCKPDGVQYILIGKDCLDYKTIVREMGLAICTGNEHQRTDRDKYVLDVEKINSLYECGVKINKSYTGCHGFRFRPRNHGNPSEAFFAGVDTDGTKLGVCRANVQGNIIPGKTRSWGNGPSKCYVSYGGSEHLVEDAFEVMTRVDGKNFGWYSMRKGQAIPQHAIAGGRNKHGEPQYIGRCSGRHHGRVTTVPGKIDQRRMFYSYGGYEYECEHFQVLQCA